ncbi:MAG TPA: class I SAM-dependent methyltransferase [Spirillospora sp.]|nr:class I SAM-dependent methyltransferase [Spirillospora sp.]
MNTQDAGSAAGHWDAVYRDRGPGGVSWFQAEPQPSLDLITELGAGADGGIIDIGGGASALAIRLAQRGFDDLTVLDLSGEALRESRLQAAEQGVDAAIRWVRADLLTWRPDRTWRIWHDRAVFHFLTDPADRAAYLATLRTALERPGGAVVIGTFAPGGPEHCSGLPVARYSAEDLAELLTGAFDGDLVITGSRVERHRTPGGAVQPFTWTTARLP